MVPGVKLKLDHDHFSNKIYNAHLPIHDFLEKIAPPLLWSEEASVARDKLVRTIGVLGNN